MKPKNVLPFNWRRELENVEVHTIGNDVVLLDRPVITSTFKYPFKVDVNTNIISISGSTEGVINLKPYKTEGACLISILAGQIMEYKSISDDFTGLFIVMSSKFLENMIPNSHERLPLYLSVRNNPVIPLNDEALKGMITYFEMLKRIIQVENHPYKLEVARYLTLAFSYGASVDFHNLNENTKKSHNEQVVDKFLHLVQTNYKEERGLDFYAAKLCISPKHLSKVIKATGGKPPNDLIDEHVVYEAKALLKSTNMTIQQITDELNFPSQSFFGKYFKRVTGMSPKEYKNEG